MTWPELLPLLVHIQTHLDGKLSLDTLGSLVSRSPSHLHRTFKSVIGETPKDYISRLRLERAAFCLLIHDSTILEIALDCGFANHETFTRAFRRRFGLSPNAYRTRMKSRSNARINRADISVSPDSSLSETKVKLLRPAHLAFIRHVGPYESVPDRLFSELDTWAMQKSIGPTRIWMGLGHDAPGITSPEKLRFDAALAVPSRFTPTKKAGYQYFPGGEFAVTTHVGPYSSIASAYPSIVARIRNRSSLTFRGLPVVEIYRCIRVNSSIQLNETDLCLPVSTH